uniref:RimM N-terminal domain-containing protein n=1 Tax=Leersia perrieri TaxID=77586 RepID=A0A0D9WJT6_9ORYZ
MASPASASASASAPVSLFFSPSPPCRALLRRLPSPYAHFPPRRLALAPARPSAAPALLSSLSDAHEEEEEEEAEEEEYEEEVEEEEMVEVGYVSGAHGVRGDVLVAPRTDFPQLRFATPGKRWLRARAAGKQQVKEFELVSGRAHTGKKGWIVSFDGINTVDEARQIVGSAILVKAGDRPKMEEDEIYSLDLVGMRVIVKDTGKLVGTVAQVFNFGAGDLLQVMVGDTEDIVSQPNSENQDPTPSGEHVWIPFAEDIVPDVDVESREMWITPPKGLLELNARSDKRSKKERRAMEWKEKKRLQRRVIAAKKILSEMDQGHVLEGLLSGDKVQKASLAEQIGSIDFQLFRHAMHSVSRPIGSLSKNVFVKSSSSRKKLMRIPYETLMNNEENVNFSSELNEGVRILQKSKAATILITDDSVTLEAEFQGLLDSYNKSMKVEETRGSLPFVIVCPAGHVESIQNCLVKNDYFGLDTQKVWVLEEMKLPIVSMSSKLNSRKILLKSPWEILQKPAGSGVIFSLLSSSKILDTLNEMGVEYVQICSLSNKLTVGHPLLFGAVSSFGSDAGLMLCKSSKETEGDFDMILSMSHINKMCRDVTKLRFSAQPEQQIHIEHVDGEWVTIQPEAANCHRLHVEVTSVLNYCSPDKVCVIEIVEQ